MKKDAYVWFWEKYEEVPPKHEQLFDVVPSDAAYSKFTSAIGLGELLEKPEVCKNRSFGRIVRFSYETVKDAQKPANILADTVGSWGRMVPITKEKFYAKFFNYGAMTAGNDVFDNSITGVITDSSGDLIYDGKAFFATDHPDRVGNTYSNYSASNSLTHSNLKTVYTTYTTTNNRDERGEVIDLLPDVLLIPPALKFTAQEILNTTLIPNSADNTTNVLAAIVEPLEWAYLTDTDGWFLGRRKMGLMATQREDVTIDFWQDETSKDYFASVFTRFGGCVTNWRFCNRSLPESRDSENNGVNCWKLHFIMDNQQPSLSRNALEGSETSGRSLTENAEGSNSTTSALLPVYGMKI